LSESDFAPEMMIPSSSPRFGDASGAASTTPTATNASRNCDFQFLNNLVMPLPFLESELPAACSHNFSAESKPCRVPGR
jgi:hypothetical protein